MAMQQAALRLAAAEELRRRNCVEAEATVASLCDGLTQLVDLMLTRVQRDAEEEFGLDSMLMPATAAGEVKAVRRAKDLINIYTSVVAAEEAIEQKYVDDEDDWFVRWLLPLRMEVDDWSPVEQQIADYRGHAPHQRRRVFVSALERNVPYATKAPLVLYRLYPLAVRIVVAIAFGDHLRAGELRNQQASILPVISDCHVCHGRPFDNGENCGSCGSPLWSYAWLRAAD